MDHLNFYIIPSLSAIVIKGLIFWYWRKNLLHLDKWMWMLLLGMLGLNIAELLIFITPFTGPGGLSLFILKLYYACSLFVGVGFLSVALKLKEWYSKKIEKVMYALLVVSTIATVGPNLAIVGAESIGYSITRIAGDFYWVIQVTLLFTMFAGLATLAICLQKNENSPAGRRSLALILGAMPTIFVVTFVLMAMQQGYKINATLLTSISTNLWLLVFVYTEKDVGLFKFLSLIPATSEFKISRKVTESLYFVGKTDLGEVVANFEKVVLNEALKQSEGNKTLAADMLGISRTTLRRKLQAVTVES